MTAIAFQAEQEVTAKPAFVAISQSQERPVMSADG